MTARRRSMAVIALSAATVSLHRVPALAEETTGAAHSVLPAATATDVVLQVNASTGSMTLISAVQGFQTVITAYTFKSASGSLVKFKNSGSRFLGTSFQNNPGVFYTSSNGNTYNNWTGIKNTSTIIGEGFGNNYIRTLDTTWTNYTIPVGGYSFGNMFKPLASGGVEDLTFQWDDRSLNTYTSVVRYTDQLDEPLWGGNGKDNKWHNSANWYNTQTSDGLPSPSDNLFFNGVTPQMTTLNDYPTDTQFPGIYFGFQSSAGAYTLNGNRLMTNFINNASASLQTINLDLLTPAQTLSVSVDQSGAAVLMNGVISGPGSVSKNGNGILTLTGSNTYAGGTFVRGGTLRVQNAYALGGGSVSVQTGTLSGRGGFAGQLVVSAGGIVAPGIDGSGSLATASSAVLSAGTLSISIDDTAATATQLSANGITLGATLQLAGLHSAGLPSNTSFIIVDNTSAQPVSGIFANLSNGATISDGSNVFTISYFGGDGNDITLTLGAPIPEPATVGVAMIGIAAGLLRRRRTALTRT